MRRFMKLLVPVYCFGMSLPLMAAETADAPKKVSASFISVVLENGLLGIGIWSMMFITSMVALWLIIDAMLNVKKAKLCPDNSMAAIKSGLEAGDLTHALAVCKEQPSFITAIMQACFEKIPKGFNAMEDAAVSSIEDEEEKLMQRINYLNLCGAVAPMLGLLGTVTGMLNAFFALGTTTGVEKAQVLALSISQALYTTAAGLVIAIPSLIAYSLFKNKATRIVIHIERQVSDILKDLEGRIQ